MNKSLLLVLITAFLDILGLSILLPVFPEITAHFHQSESWTMWTQSVYAVGMFFSGIFIWNLSDKYGRKKMLIVTSWFNLLGYIATLYALNIGSTIGITGFAIYLSARLIAGIGGSGFWVVQAYISDISTSETRTKNMWMMGAAFWTAFLVWPAIGWILASHWGTNGILYVSIAIIAINFLWIIFGLPEPTHHMKEMGNVDIKEWKMTNEIYVLLFLSLGATIGFSVINSWSGQFYTDKFDFDSKLLGYTMAMVWLISIIYQWFLVKYVRKYLNEEHMMQTWLLVLTIGMILLAINETALLVFLIIILFPLGMWSFNPSLSSLLSKDAGKHAGRVMWMNTSVTGIGWIIWPVLTGWLYGINITLPFWASAWLFFVLFIISILFLWTKKWRDYLFLFNTD
jgi:DHA1 family tetracycline resistance protein-like MFS transporter